MLVDVSHVVEHGMVTYKGLPAPLVCDFLSREQSRSHYAPGTEFHIGKIEMVANTGTYLDSPFHRYADDKDLSGVGNGKGGTMQTFDLNDLAAESERTSQRWREFLRVSSLSMGLYRLKAGQSDEQRPHTEDEVYLVVSGKASFRAGGWEQAVAPGSLIFVERDAEHRFVDITEDLTVLVFFAPPEGLLKDGGLK
jgi:quercetin dioxygenase-like cupin family protein